VLAPLATTQQTKDDMLSVAQEEQREGVMFRLATSTYQSGRRSTELRKHKLINDADVIVTALHPAKESATVSVHDDGALVEVGAASTLGKGPIAVGQVWTVTFLYVADPHHPRMVQPRLDRQRHDKTPGECVVDQFVDAGTRKIV
jgi:nucleoside 2-deoxyribosyltransferase